MTHAAMNADNANRAKKPNEFAILAAAIDAGNDPLPPYVSKIILNAPESFDDQRAGQVAAEVKVMRAGGVPVNQMEVGKRVPKFLDFIISELADPASPAVAEYHAQVCWDNYSTRRVISIGDDLTASLAASPLQAKAIATTALAALESVLNESNTLSEKLAARLYLPAAKPAEPTPRYSISGTPICTQDNLATISAQAKGGKSAVIGAMIASTFAVPGVDCLGFASENSNCWAVIHLDTEQSPYDHWDSLQKALHRAGVSVPPPWLCSYCLTGLSVDEVRSSIRVVMEQAATQFGGIHSVLIDGTADAAHDVNDPAEAGSLVAELHSLAIKFHSPVINVIHVNPGSESKTRGHLGSQLERKSETNLRLEKDENGVTVVWADKNRRAPIPKSTAPRFAWCHQAGMHVSMESHQSSKEAAMLQDLQTEAHAVFTAAGKSAVRHGQFITLLKQEVHISESTAKRHFGQMQRTGIIARELTGLYALA